MAGPQAPHHQTIKLGPIGQGSSAVTMVPGDPLHTSVFPQVLELPCSTGPPSFPFFLWLLPSTSQRGLLKAWAWAHCAHHGSLLPRASLQGRPCSVPAFEGVSFGKGAHWPRLSPLCGLRPHSFGVWFGHVPLVVPDLGWCSQAGRNGCLQAGQTLTTGPWKPPSPTPLPGPSCGKSVPPPSPGRSIPTHAHSCESINITLTRSLFDDTSESAWHFLNSGWHCRAGCRSQLQPGAGGGEGDSPE